MLVLYFCETCNLSCFLGLYVEYCSTHILLIGRAVHTSFQIIFVVSVQMNCELFANNSISACFSKFSSSSIIEVNESSLDSRQFS